MPTYEQPVFRLEPGFTEILLARHGQSVPADPAQPFALQEDGRGDPELSPLGKTQADLLCARLASEPIAAIYATTLRRTSQTAAPLAKRLGLEIRIEPDLVEVGLGAVEGGLYRMHMAEGHPLALALMKEKRWDLIPGAESNASLQSRTTQAIARIVRAHQNEKVLVVAHGGSIASLLAFATDAPIFSFLGAENASLSSVVVGEDRWILRLFNDTAHLEPRVP